MFKDKCKFGYYKGEYRTREHHSTVYTTKEYSFKVMIINITNDICEIRYDKKNLISHGESANEIKGLGHIININRLEGIHEVDVNIFERFYWFLTEKYNRL